MTLTRLFLTGEPGVGKTTLIRKVVKGLQDRGIVVDGMVSSEIREGGSRIGFQIEDVSTHEIGELAKSSQPIPGAPMVGKYVVNVAEIERVGVVAIRRASKVADVVIVDEIGPMELKSSEFVLAVEKVLSANKNFIGTLHKRASHSLTDTIRANYQIIEITPANRNRMEFQIISKFM